MVGVSVPLSGTNFSLCWRQWLSMVAVGPAEYNQVFSRYIIHDFFFCRNFRVFPKLPAHGHKFAGAITSHHKFQENTRRK